MTKTLSSVSLIKRASLLNRVTYNLKLSFSYCLMFNKLDENLLYLCPPMKCETKFLLNSLKVEMVLRAVLLNHTLASPLSVVGKTLHMILSRTPCSYIRVLNDSRWSNRSFGPSYASTYGIWNLVGRGKEVTYVVKGESVQWTSSLRSMDTCPLMAFIIIYILSFIICMSCTICNALPSSSDQRLMSFHWSRLLATLLSSLFSLSWWSPVEGWLLLRLSCSCSSQCSLGHHSFLWFSCYSDSWLSWVSRLTAATRVYTCLSKALRGFPVAWLMVAIECI